MSISLPPARRRCGPALALAAASLLVLLQPSPSRAEIPDPITVEDFNLPAQDAQGWTQLRPLPDSRLIYVDSVDGDDASGRVYTPETLPPGANPQQPPAGSVRAYRTLAAAYAQLRQDQPDWLLLRAGRVWTGESLRVKRGRSASARQVVTSYGQGARPELRTGAAQGIAEAQMSNVAIIGLRFWAHTRDPAGPHYQSMAGASGISLFTRLPGDVRQVHDILIEDCVFRSYANNVLTGTNGGDALPISRFVMRRSIVSGNYTTQGHSQGLYHVGKAELQPSILLEENLFDHNGWRIQSRAGNNAQADGQATMFNHNTYFTAAHGVIFRGNLFLRASSIGNKWTSTSRGVVVEDNLYTEGEIGMSIGGNDPGAHRFKDYVVRDNVVTDIGRTRPTNRSLSWGVELLDWDSGNFTGNLIAHQRAGIGNTYALQVSAAGGARDVWITDNVIANLQADGPLVRLRNGNNSRNVVYRDNRVQSPATQPSILLESGGYVFAGSNRYQSAAAANRQFRINGSDRDLAGWRSASGDTGAEVGLSFPDAERTLERYAAELGLGASLDALIRAMHTQSRASWNPALTASAINRWMRAGFAMENAATSPLTITRFVLTDAANTRDIAVLTEGLVLPRASLPAMVNIRAETETDGSVAFLMTGPVSLDRFEIHPPYTAAVEPVGFAPRAGTYRLTATAYEQDNLQGRRGTPLTRSFTVSDAPPGGSRQPPGGP